MTLALTSKPSRPPPTKISSIDIDLLGGGYLAERISVYIMIVFGCSTRSDR